LKEFIKKQLRRFGIDVGLARQDRTLMDFVANRGISVVFDVGANVGQFGESLRSAGYRGKIISFEPIPAVFRTLADRAAADGNWEAHNLALGSTAGQATINVSEVSVFSSLLPATRAAAVFDSAAVATHPETIELRTLDEVFGAPSGKTLLKIDTQGFEKQVLEGGLRSLAGLEGVLMELPIIHLYERTWQLHEALVFMAERGFVPAQIHPVSFHWKDTASFVEVDCLFRRRDEALD
jgi:FkbM family methyltransferase